jgi:hypothetical protein
VNAPLEGAGGGAGGAPRAPPRRTCALCEAAPTAPVTVFNSKQLSVVAGDLLCADCAGRDAAAVESVRATAAAERRALLEGLDAAATPPLLAAPPLPPLRGAVEEGGGEDVAGGAYRALPDADLALNDGGGAPGAPEPPPPVPFLVQFLAVLKLRLRTSAPPSLTCKGLCCSTACFNVAMVVVASILTVATSGSTTPITLVHCGAGFWADNSTGATVCNRNIYIDSVAGAVGRTDDIGSWAQRAAAAPAAPVVDPTATMAALLYRRVCATPDDYSCFFPLDTSYKVPDFRALSLAYGAGASDITPSQPRARFAYADAPAVAAGGAPFSSLDLLGGGFLAAAPQGAANAPITAFSTGGAAPNDFFFSVQRTIRDSLAPLNDTCRNIVDGSGDGRNRVIYGFSVGGDPADWAAEKFPAAGVTLRANDAERGAFGYDLRAHALRNDYSQSGYTPYRSANYYYVAVFGRSAREVSQAGCYGIGHNGNAVDNVFNTNGGLAAHLAANMLHGGFLREAVNASASPVAAANASILAAFAPMPIVTWIPGAGFAPPSPYQTLIWPLFTMTALPGITAALAQERGDKLWALMSMSGVRRAPYLAGHYAAGVLFFLPVGVAYVAAGYLAGAASFVLPSPWLFVVLLLVWAHAQAGWGLLLGVVLGSPRVGSILCYLLAVAVALTNFLVTQLVTPWPPALTWVPFLSYARAATLVFGAVGWPLGAPGARIAEALGATFLQGTLALLVGAYLHAVVPGPESAGVTLSPFFPCVAVARWWRAWRGGGGDADGGGAPSPPPSSPSSSSSAAAPAAAAAASAAPAAPAASADRIFGAAPRGAPRGARLRAAPRRPARPARAPRAA